ncbi:hypothetical protein EX30DRAFT_397363 [Ascodesmis nigricans]|uniref:Uncharacterized protein n=1 Tax=Ascodesmis nigricans TaxID=341454 RepID=A0A4S2MPC2_9PEZI|nr:hypothetical protein EX30DRAFT_397363 [Ascodesmis nigricans]
MLRELRENEVKVVEGVGVRVVVEREQREREQREREREREREELERAAREEDMREIEGGDGGDKDELENEPETQQRDYKEDEFTAIPF